MTKPLKILERLTPAKICSNSGLKLIACAPSGTLDLRASDFRKAGSASEMIFDFYPRTIEFVAKCP